MCTALRCRAVGSLVGVVGSVALFCALAGSAAATPSVATLRSTWTKLTPLVSPSPRATTMAYDAKTHQVVLFGGYGPGALDDTWTWDGTSWTQQTPAHVPTARVAQQMVYDAQTGQLLMFGGDQIAVRGLDDTWVWTGSDWTQLSPPTSPPNRNSAAIAYDPATHQVVMFGGVQYALQQQGSIVTRDTWTWDGTTWTYHAPLAGGPPPTSGGSMAFDPAIGKLVLFGGIKVPNDTWAWDGTNWTKLSLPVSPPSQFPAPLALDPAAGEVILASTGVLGASVADTWALDSGWTMLHPSVAPPLRLGAAVATDPATGHLVEFGGGLGALSNETWVWGPLLVSARPLRAGATGLPYSQTLQATGGTGTLHWKLTAGALPAGLSLTPAGVLSGTPTATGTSSFKVTVTDSSTPAQSASRAMTVTVGTGPAPSFYVANGANSQVHGFALSARDDAVPSVTLAGPHTALNGPSALLFSSIGELYVANANIDTVDLFPVGASGDATPSRVLAGTQTALHSPDGLALGAGGELYVANRSANSITVYAPDAGGDATPIRTIAGPDTQLNSPEGLAIDSAGELWVANTPSNSLTVYQAGAEGDAPPARVITHANGLYGPQGLTQRPDGQLLVANTYAESITTFAAAGDPTPSTILSGPATQLSFPIGVDIDASGRLYVANQFGGVNIYAPGASGNAAPLATIAGTATDLSAPAAIAVTPPLYVANRSLPRAAIRMRYHAQLFAGLGRAPLHWAIAAGRLPRGLTLTRSGQILGTPRRASTTSITFQVTDSSHRPMRARRRLELRIT